MYHEYAEDLPIIDYHCHLPAEQIATDHRFANLTQIWLYGDHYKWRAMRACGTAERYCTGDASDWEKFAAWAATIPYAIRNPLYHWTHMELEKPFGMKGAILTPETAREIYDTSSALLQQDDFRARGIMQRFGVTAVGWQMRKGIVAVDPRVVNLFTRVYVPDYGVGIAADTGGAVKGRRIDLGYGDDDLILWYDWVDVYLLTPVPPPDQIRWVLP